MAGLYGLLHTILYASQCASGVPRLLRIRRHLEEPVSVRIFSLLPESKPMLESHHGCAQASPAAPQWGGRSTVIRDS
jgi:hypothetical protein